MTGPEHYRDAEDLLAQVVTAEHQKRPYDAERLTARAQAHATLALAAATAMGLNDLPAPDWDAWRDVAAARVSGEARS